MSECRTCSDSKFVPSGIMTDTIKSKGRVLKLDLKIPIQMPCPRCNISVIDTAGSAALKDALLDSAEVVDEGFEVCPTCKGDGIQWRHAPHDRHQKHDCPKCNGTGKTSVSGEPSEAKDES